MAYNDYYLLYLISLHEDSAFDILYEKYLPLIKHRVMMLGLNDSDDIDNYLMEADNMFMKAIYTYNPNISNKTFTRYFELILVRRLNYLRYLDYKHRELFVTFDESYMLGEEEDSLSHPSSSAYKVRESQLSSFEKEVFKLVQKGINPQQIAITLDVKPKKVYNAIQRIKQKTLSYYR